MTNEWTFDCEHCGAEVNPDLEYGYLRMKNDPLDLHLYVDEVECPDCTHDVDVSWPVDWNGSELLPIAGQNVEIEYTNTDGGDELKSIAMAWLRYVEEFWPEYFTTATDTDMRCGFNDWMDSEHQDSFVSDWAVMNVTHEEIKGIIKQYYIRELGQTNPYQ